MRTVPKILLITVTVGTFGIVNAARDNIQVVGSSTVYPFATVVAETFGKTTDFKTPVIESTGSGGGMKLFCAGVGQQHPDITNASRRMKSSEFEKCQVNGVTDIIEVKVGYDGIVFGNYNRTDPLSVTRRDIFMALAKEIPNPDGSETFVPNPHMTWKDVNPGLPDIEIEVLGPPPTSGTRDAFAELALEGGCNTFDWIRAMKKSNNNAYKVACHSVREDGAYIESGENDNLIVQKLRENPKAFGVFGFSFLDQNADVIQGSLIDGVAPEFENIADGSYPVSRPLYLYAKKAHIGIIPGIQEYLNAFTDEAAWGNEGYLTDKGLIPMPDEERSKFGNDAVNLIPMTM